MTTLRIAEHLKPEVQHLPEEDSNPLVADARGIAKLLCSGIRTVRTWDAAGKIPSPIRIGGRVVWRLDEIRAWLDAGAPDRATWTAIRAAQTKSR